MLFQYSPFLGTVLRVWQHEDVRAGKQSYSGTLWAV